MGGAIQDRTIHAYLHRRVNERTLCFNPVEWIDLYNHNDATQIPRQKEVNPYGRDDEANQRARIDKRKNYERREQG